MLKAALFSALLLSFLLLSTTFISCAGGAGSPKGSDSEETSLAIKLPDTAKTLYEKNDIVTFTVTISSGSYNSTKTASKGETMRFSNIPAGTYSVTAYGKIANGSIAAKCVTSVKIVSGETTSTTLHLSRLDYYVVTFRQWDETEISHENVTTGYTVPKPADPTKEGYNFSGWRTSKTATSSFDFNTPITSHTDLYAKFGIKTYKITFNYNGGTVGTATSTTVETDYNTTPTVPSTAPTRTAPDGSAYTFMGWNETSDATTIIAGFDAATANKTYYAVWSPKVKVTFDYNGGTNAGSTKKEVYPNKDTAPDVPASTEEPSKSGCKFKGWASTSNATVADNTVSTTPVSADTTYYAVWLPAYTITYSSTPTIDTTSETFSGKLSYTSDEGLSSMPEPEVSGLTFDDWYTDTAFTPANKLTSIAPGTTGNVTLYAKWKVTVTFDYNGGKVGSSTSSEADYDYASTFSSIKPSTNPTKSHAAFKHWSTVSDGTGTAVSGTSSVTTSTTYYAIWDSTEITYESPVTLNTNFTSETGSYRSYTAGTAYTLPEPTAAEQTALKLTFAGWYEDEDFTGSRVTTIPATATGEKTFYAKWTATVTFDTQGGSDVTAQTVVYDKTATKPIDPTKTGDEFINWYTGTVSEGKLTYATSAYSFTTKIKNNITLYAKWRHPITNFEGTAAEFLEAYFVQGNNKSTAYEVKITSATEDELKQIARAIGNATASNYKGVYIKLDLSACGAETIPDTCFHSDGVIEKLGTYLTEIKLPNGLKSIGKSAFSQCENITGSVTIPAGVTKIEECAFSSCKKISEITFSGSSVTTLGRYAFSGTNITSFTVLASVTYIGWNAFYNTSLTSFNVEGTNNWRSLKGTGLTKEIFGVLDLETLTSKGGDDLKRMVD